MHTTSTLRRLKRLQGMIDESHPNTRLRVALEIICNFAEGEDGRKGVTPAADFAGYFEDREIEVAIAYLQRLRKAQDEADAFEDSGAAAATAELLRQIGAR